MARLVRVARAGDAVIVESGGWYSLVSEDRTIQGSADTLSSLLSAGSWRKPLKDDQERYALLASAVDGTVPMNRSVRPPKAVKEAIVAAASTLPMPFLSEFASKTSVSIGDVHRLLSLLNEAEEKYNSLGGEAAKEWATKVITPAVAVTAAGSFVPNEELTYIATGPYEGRTQMDSLFAAHEDGTVYRWNGKEFTPVPIDLDSLEAPSVMEIDEETAKVLADWIEDDGDGTLDIAQIDTEEFNLFSLAESEMDWEELDRLNAVVADASGYSPLDRSKNVSRQIRDGGGRFAGRQVPEGDKLTAYSKSRLPQEVAVISNPAAFVEHFLSTIRPTSQAPVTAAGEVAEGTQALYMAIVDPVDRTAVLDAVAIMAGEDGEPTSWKRSDGKWVHAPEILEDLRGVTPPTVVELDGEELIKNVLSQIDEYDSSNHNPLSEQVDEEGPVTASAGEFRDYSEDTREEYAKKGYALPDGSYPIANAEDLKRAVQAYGRAPESKRAQVRRHIRKRARALNRPDIIPSSWKETAVEDIMAMQDDLSPLYGPNGEIVAAGVPGIADTPSDMQNVQRLRNYWTWGKGAAKIRWGTPGDLTRCARHLRKYMPGREWGYCQERHHQRFGKYNPESGGR